MRYTWPKKSMLELFLNAEKGNETSVELKSNYEAELFRFALYNFRRRNKNGDRFIDFQIEVKNNKLTIYKQIEVEIKKNWNRILIPPTHVTRNFSHITN